MISKINYIGINTHTVIKTGSWRSAPGLPGLVMNSGRSLHHSDLGLDLGATARYFGVLFLFPPSCYIPPNRDGAAGPSSADRLAVGARARGVQPCVRGDGPSGVHASEAPSSQAAEEAQRRVRQHEDGFPGAVGTLPEAPGRGRPQGDLHSWSGPGHQQGHQHCPAAAGQQSRGAAAGGEHLHGGARGRSGAGRPRRSQGAHDADAQQLCYPHQGFLSRAAVRV